MTYLLLNTTSFLALETYTPSVVVMRALYRYTPVFIAEPPAVHASHLTRVVLPEATSVVVVVASLRPERSKISISTFTCAPALSWVTMNVAVLRTGF